MQQLRKDYRLFAIAMFVNLFKVHIGLEFNTEVSHCVLSSEWVWCHVGPELERGRDETVENGRKVDGYATRKQWSA